MRKLFAGFKGGKLVCVFVDAKDLGEAQQQDRLGCDLIFELPTSLGALKLGSQGYEVIGG